MDLSADSARVLDSLKQHSAPVNIILIGPPHIGKKFLIGFMRSYFGARSPQTETQSETVCAASAWGQERKLLTPFIADQGLVDLKIRIEQKSAVFTNEIVTGIGERVSRFEDQVRRALVASASAKPSKTGGSKKKKQQQQQPPAPSLRDPRPCRNIKLYLGSCLTDVYCRGHCLLAHHIIKPDAYYKLANKMTSYYWQHENLACPSRQTLYINLDPDPDFFVLRVYAYFDTVLVERLPKSVQANDTLKKEFRERYLALCLEYRTRYSELFLGVPDFATRYCTANIRFENDLTAFPLSCKFICDIIAIHISKLIKGGVWALKEGETRSATCSLAEIDRTYIVPRIRITNTSLHAIQRADKPVRINLDALPDIYPPQVALNQRTNSVGVDGGRDQVQLEQEIVSSDEDEQDAEEDQGYAIKNCESIPQQIIKSHNEAMQNINRLQHAPPLPAHSSCRNSKQTGACLDDCFDEVDLKH